MGGARSLGAVNSRAAPARSVEMKFRVCELTGKRRNAKAMTVTFSHTRNHKVQAVNLQDRKLWWPEGNRFVKMRVSTKALKVRPNRARARKPFLEYSVPCPSLPSDIDGGGHLSLSFSRALSVVMSVHKSPYARKTLARTPDRYAATISLSRVGLTSPPRTTNFFSSIKDGERSLRGAHANEELFRSWFLCPKVDD